MQTGLCFLLQTSVKVEATTVRAVGTVEAPTGGWALPLSTLANRWCLLPSFLTNKLPHPRYMDILRKGYGGGLFGSARKNTSLFIFSDVSAKLSGGWASSESTQVAGGHWHCLAFQAAVPMHAFIFNVVVRADKSERKASLSHASAHIIRSTTTR